MSDLPQPHIWTLTDERAGNLHQAQALARAMGGADHHVVLRLPAPWRWLAPHGVIGALGRMQLPVDSPWPDIAIGCGRQSALALRALKRHRRIFTVQILDPRFDAGAYDIVVAPAHDQLAGDNVIRSIGAVHGIDDEWLIHARREFPEFAALPRPLSGVLIGGPHRDAALTESAVLALLDEVGKLSVDAGGSLLVCGSRRTPEAWRPLIRARTIALGGRVWMDHSDGINTYRGCLAHADRLFVTADSVNMLSEACAVGVPVTSDHRGGLSGKLSRFHEGLQQAHLLSSLQHPCAPLVPLRETAGIADRILKRWRESTGG
jgi:uncharacterized protein